MSITKYLDVLKLFKSNICDKNFNLYYHFWLQSIEMETKCIMEQINPIKNISNYCKSCLKIVWLILFFAANAATY